MKRTLQTFAFALLLPLATSAQVTDNTPVIEASGEVITKAEFEALLKGDQRYVGFAQDENGKKALATSFARAFALEVEARKRGIDKLPSVQLKIRHAVQQLLAYELTVSLRAQYIKDDAKLAAHYAQHQLDFSQPRVRQILVRSAGSAVAARPGLPELTPAEAKAKALALRAQLLAGADFAALAQAESDDLGSRSRGGDMGFILRGATGANFEAAAFALPIARLSDVIQTEQGFHLLRVEERKAPPLADVKAALANDLAHREMEQILDKGYKLNAAYFKP